MRLMVFAAVTDEILEFHLVSLIVFGLPVTEKHCRYKANHFGNDRVGSGNSEGNWKNLSV